MSLSVNREIRKARRLAEDGDVDLAETIYKDVLDRFPRNRRAIEGLRLLQSHKFSEAPPDKQLKTLISLYSQGKFEEVLTKGEALAGKYPSTVEVHNILGAVNAALERREKAVNCYVKALQIDPDYFEAHNNLGVVYKGLGRHDEAVVSYKKAIQVNPEYFEAHNNLGNAFKELGKFNEALSCYAEAIRINPEFAEAHNNLGNAFKELGKLNEAISSYVEALRINPDFAEAHNNLSSVKKYVKGDPHIDEMRHQLAAPDLSNHDRLRFSFALGKAYGDVGDREKAFSYLQEGNRLRKADLKYDVASDRALFLEIKSYFSKDGPYLNVKESPKVNVDQKPIFIVGMPRSGTTLVEQILASHSKVHGAGELEFLNKWIQQTDWRASRSNPNQMLNIRNGYLSDLTNLSATGRFITDKMPTNFRWLGFIFNALPEAKVVHVIRDARATCWSNFKYYLSTKGNGFGHDLRDVAEYYRMYVDLMGFWRRNFPGKIYDLNYDALTQDQECETHMLLDYLRLNWEPQCLDFHKTERAVRTASSTQVRQKMYQGSSEEWRAYAEHLGPMTDILEGL